MHLSHLQIINFRSLENVEADFDSLVNVIIGPNAIGKTTILEAIRLAKAILAPRTKSESQQAMISLGLMSPHLPQRLLAGALTHDPDKPTVVKCAFTATVSDVEKLEGLLQTLVPELALKNIGQAFANPALAMNYLSSPQGALAQQAAQTALTAEIARVKNTKKVELNLTIDLRRSLMTGEFPGQQILFAALDQHLDPSSTLFSYFPADRALPTGEQPVQFGMADTNQQLESYNSQPQLKYSRLKNMIYNTIIRQPTGRQQLSEQFSLIFDKVLKGRSLGDVGVNDIGMLSIPIIDVESGRSFDIDGLSSGEKGLILTTLLIARSIADNGLILLDEPELHLNPAVCRDLLQFLVDEFAVKKNMQAIICSHSAGILAGAFERTNCSLFHLKSGTSLAKIRQQDQGEIRDALRRLGSSESEALLYKGTVTVEGIHDAEILQSGFDVIVRRFLIKPLGGRTSIESDIRDLQKAEQKSVEIGFHYFLFDLDGKPTSLNDSPHVKLRQLKRYCLENYLLDADIITDLTREKEFSERPLANPTDTTQLMKRLALGQLNVVAAREVFKGFGLESVCFDMKVLESEAGVAAAQLLDRIGTIITQLEALKGAGFKDEYQKRVAAKVAELTAQWDDKWRDLCNGKLLLEDMRKAGHLKGDLLKLKRRVATEMRLRSTDSYNALVGLLKDLLPTN
jgi:predicted ATPase